MFVAVRAMAPVTGMPPTIGTTTLATPCATSSAFELCRPPAIESATTADSRLSSAASTATVKAGCSSGPIRSARKAGIEIVGSPPGIPPNAEPMVATGASNSVTAAVPATSATIDPGTRGTHRGSNRITASAMTPRATADVLNVGR